MKSTESSPIEEPLEQSETETEPLQNEDTNPDSKPEELKSISEVIGLETPEELVTIPAEAEVEQNTLLKAKPYDIWRNDPSTDNLYNVTKALKPTIDSVLASMGAAGNPHVAAKARIVTAKAISSYNPEAGVSLPTWVSSQLRQLSRDIRKSNNVISIPEGVQLDAYNLYRKETEFTDKHDREPTVKELADLTHMSIKRIESVRKKMVPVSNESSYNIEGANLVEGESADFSRDAIDYVYNDSDMIDQKIIEHTMGYGGAEQLDNKALMQRFKISPVQLTRRKARLGLRVKEIIDAFDQV